MKVVRRWQWATQRHGGCTTPGGIQGQIGQGSEQTQGVKDIPAHFGGSWTRRCLKVHSNPNL